MLGRARQGKTERYRELMRHLGSSDDQFEHAAGERGLVMICFTLPSLDVVFKLIRDRFPPVKNVVRQDVLDKYQFVFRHDRAGRLVDAQEFKRVRLPSPASRPRCSRNSRRRPQAACTSTAKISSSTTCTSSGAWCR